MPAITSNRETKKNYAMQSIRSRQHCKRDTVVDKSEFKPRPTVKRDEYAK